MVGPGEMVASRVTEAEGVVEGASVQPTMVQREAVLPRMVWLGMVQPKMGHQEMAWPRMAWPEMLQPRMVQLEAA